MAPSSIAHQGNEDHTLSSMMAWRVHEFGPPDVMRFERILRPHPSPGEVSSKSKPLGSVHGMAGSGPERALCRNHCPSLWARICPAKSSPCSRGTCVWEIRFMGGFRVSEKEPLAPDRH